MGRELRRVPLDFDWPLNKVWSGYLNPHDKQCDACGGRGTTPGHQYLEAVVRLLMLAGADTSRKAKHPYFNHPYGLFPDAMPSTDLTELTTGLAGRAPSFLGHDALDLFSAMKKIISAAGLGPDKWGRCPVCEGSGIDPAVKEAFDAWEPTEPPTGEGYQLWSTTSEGEPISPVFETLDALCEWAEPNATTFGYSKTSKENWKAMLSDGFVYHVDGNSVFI